MELGKDFSIAVDNVRGGSKQRPACKGYEMAIVGAREDVSKAGNKMLVLKLDICSGNHTNFFKEKPLIYFLPHHTDGLRERLARTLNAIVKDNPGIFTEDALRQDDFDESKLIGLSCGGVLKYNDRGYLDIHYITTIAEALVAPTKKPKEVVNKDSDVEDNIFA